MARDIPNGPVPKTPGSQGQGPGSIPGQGTISHKLQRSSGTQQRRSRTWQQEQCSQINKSATKYFLKITVTCRPWLRGDSALGPPV